MDVREGVERDASHHGSRAITKVFGGITVRSLMQRDGKDHGNGIDRNGLNEVRGVHRAIVSKKLGRLSRLQTQQRNVAAPFAHRTGRQFIADDVVTQVYAFIANKDRRTSNQFLNFMLAFTAKRAVQRLFAGGSFFFGHSVLRRW